ncbi:MAG: hypothetical protein ACI837_002178 [Crocinitomicaceae bacterium]|jgi:hypothetical protein
MKAICFACFLFYSFLSFSQLVGDQSGVYLVQQGDTIKRDTTLRLGMTLSNGFYYYTNAVAHDSLRFLNPLTGIMDSTLNRISEPIYNGFGFMSMWNRNFSEGRLVLRKGDLVVMLNEEGAEIASHPGSFATQLTNGISFISVPHTAEKNGSVVLMDADGNFAYLDEESSSKYSFARHQPYMGSTQPMYVPDSYYTPLTIKTIKGKVGVIRNNKLIVAPIFKSVKVIPIDYGRQGYKLVCRKMSGVVESVYL